MLTFEPNKEYVRGLLDTQMDLTTLGAGYVREAHERLDELALLTSTWDDRGAAEERDRVVAQPPHRTSSSSPISASEPAKRM